MNHISQQIFEYLGNELSENEKSNFEKHLENCAQCSEEFQIQKKLWIELGSVSEKNPSPKLSKRFYEMLKNEEQFLTETKVEKTNWFSMLFPKKPAVQFAVALGMLLVGIFLGFGMKSVSEKGESEQSIALLRDEVKEMNKMLTVSLLQQQSATERLRGVSLCSQTEGKADPEITNALIQTLKFDGNVNVRLAALDVLKEMVNQQSVRTELIEALPIQKSPMMQIAMVDLMVDLKEKNSVDVMRKMLTEPDLNVVAKNRLEMGIKQLL